MQCCASECDDIAAKDAITAHSVYSVEVDGYNNLSGRYDEPAKYHGFFRWQSYNNAQMIFVSNTYTDKLFQSAGFEKEQMSCLGSHGGDYGYRVPITYLGSWDSHNDWISNNPEKITGYSNPVIYINGEATTVSASLTYCTWWYNTDGGGGLRWDVCNGSPGIVYGSKHPSRCGFKRGLETPGKP